LLFLHYRVAKSLDSVNGFLANENLVYKNEVGIGTFNRDFWMVVQLQSRDYFTDHTLAVFQHVPRAMFYLNNTTVAGYINIRLWLGINVLLHGIFVGPNELIVES
jgi:hypothetical protein